MNGLASPDFGIWTSQKWVQFFALSGFRGSRFWLSTVPKFGPVVWTSGLQTFTVLHIDSYVFFDLASNVNDLDIFVDIVLISYIIIF